MAAGTGSAAAALVHGERVEPGDTHGLYFVLDLATGLLLVLPLHVEVRPYR